MSKFRVGDKVVVKAKEEIRKYPSYVSSMGEWSGKLLTIKGVPCGGYTYIVEENSWSWDQDMFESPTEKATQILATTIVEEKIKRYQEIANKYFNFQRERSFMNKNEIKAVRNYNDRAMVMQFTKKDYNWKPIQTRCEVQDGDTFDLGEGIKTCLLKYLLGGHKQYMQIMDAARKAYKKTIESDKKIEAEKNRKMVESVENKFKKFKNNMRKKEYDTEVLINAIKKVLEEYDRDKANASCDAEEEDN